MLGFQVAVESPPPGDPSESEASRILFGGVVMVRGDLEQACGCSAWRERPATLWALR
jgi:hypothetical protein